MNLAVAVLSMFFLSDRLASWVVDVVRNPHCRAVSFHVERKYKSALRSVLTKRRFMEARRIHLVRDRAEQNLQLAVSCKALQSPDARPKDR